jgi:hypothetical protein
MDLLEKVKNADPAELTQIVKLWTNGKQANIEKTINEIQDKISAFVSSNYSIREYTKETSKIGEIRSKMRKGDLTPEEADKQIKQLKEDALKKVKE